MANKDPNFVNPLLAGLNTDGRTIISVAADPTSHKLKVSDGVAGTDHGPSVALKDVNGVSSLLATSSADGETPVVVYADINGNLLIDST